MTYYIGCDAHKHYSLFAVLDDKGQLHQQIRINHAPSAIKDYLSQFPKGTPVALETVGNWYWIVDEIEESGCTPKMAHAAKAKVMMGNVNKTDKLDAKGLATLERLAPFPSSGYRLATLETKGIYLALGWPSARYAQLSKTVSTQPLPSTTSHWIPQAISSFLSGKASFCMPSRPFLQKLDAVWNRSLSYLITSKIISSAWKSVSWSGSSSLIPYN